MASHRSLSDSKSPQVSRTLLSILADLNHAVVWMVSTCSLIFMPYFPFTNPLKIVPSAPIIIGITVTLMFQIIFSYRARSTYLPLFPLFVLFSLCGLPERQRPLFGRFPFFFADYHYMWSSSRNLVIHLYFKISEKCLSLILQDRLGVILILLFVWKKFNSFNNSQRSMRFQLYTLVSISFLVLLRYSFFIFFYFISNCLMVSASNIPKYL